MITWPEECELSIPCESFSTTNGRKWKLSEPGGRLRGICRGGRGSPGLFTYPRNGTFVRRGTPRPGKRPHIFDFWRIFMKRRIFSFLLAVVMVLSLAPSVFAAEDDPGMSITFSNTTPDPGDTVTALITVDADADFSTALGYGVDLWYDPEWEARCSGHPSAGI